MNNKISIFLKRALKFVILLPFVWFAFIILWGTFVPEKLRKNLIYTKAPGFTDLRLQEANQVQNIDLLIVGSSHVYRGVDPRSFEARGFRSFNLGSTLQSPLQTEYLLRRYVDQMKPKVVLFEVGYKTFSSDGIEGAIDVIINNDKLDWDILRMATEVNDVTVFNTLAYTFFRKTILGKTRREYLDAHMDQYIPGGFVERKDLAYIGPESFNNTTKPLKTVQQEAFESCLNYLTSKNIKTILIQTPILKEYYASIQNMDDFNS